MPLGKGGNDGPTPLETLVPMGQAKSEDETRILERPGQAQNNDATQILAHPNAPIDIGDMETVKKDPAAIQAMLDGQPAPGGAAVAGEPKKTGKKKKKRRGACAILLFYFVFFMGASMLIVTAGAGVIGLAVITGNRHMVPDQFDLVLPDQEPTPDIEVEPEPEPEPEPKRVRRAKPKARPSGSTVVIRGDIPREIWFVRGAQRFPAGALSPGTYVVEASWGPNAAKIVGEIDVAADAGEIRVQCSKGWGKCSQR